MNDIFNKKLSEIFGKVDEKMIQAKLNAAIDMLKKGNTEELARKINKVDKNELLSKINEFDESKLKEFNIDKNELKSKISNADLNKLAQIIGEHGDEIVAKIKEIIK
ncbi:membrane trafficking protein [Pseudoclostridium thermosuccinogenes]|jgi:hypothetical protein|uniref:membrane trafficking protein n=1 Tax=Clostridium thermosuccinogenes TaxID=84032 RepID=UPI000CCC1DD2|nr:membrane trafficking protein [Pseudoclostridium thermosuccinogenes]PNT94024.1 membrane trafficking protein [Pseudoclostridium thermosuccinogenes]